MAGLWTLSFGLSQPHGYGSWLVCEVALKLWRLNPTISCWMENDEVVQDHFTLESESLRVQTKVYMDCYIA